MNERSAVVIGGCTGIGLAVSRALIARGYTVTGTALGAADQAAGAAALAVPEFHTTLLDVRNALAVARFGAGFDRLDALVNCAGIALGSPAEHDEEGFLAVIDVNLNGMMRACTALKAALFAAKGAVVNIASILSIFGSANAPAYSASKGGVMQLTRSLAIAWADAGVRVNAVAPGWVRTALTAPVQANAARDAAILARTPMQRWGEPADIAGPVAFLLSDDARFVTGAVLAVDGGYSAT